MQTETPTTFAQKDFYGQDLHALFPLGLFTEGVRGRTDDGLSESPEEKVRKVYGEWLRTNKFGPQICFLDITFGPDTGVFTNSSLRTIIFTSQSGSMDAYKKVLDDFFESGDSLAAHPVFRAGLPIFRNRTNRNSSQSTAVDTGGLSVAGQHGFPEDDNDLARFASPERFELMDDGYLSAVFNTPTSSAGSVLCAPADSFTEDSHSPSFRTRSFRTYTGSKLDQRDAGSDKKLSGIWDNYSGLLRENSADIVSWRGKPLNSVFALPVGLRDPANPRHFSWIADVYVGFDCDTGVEDSRNFIRQLLLQLMRANTLQKTKTATLQHVMENFGHEVKRVTRVLSPAWVLPMRDLFEVRASDAPGDHSVLENKIGDLTLSDAFSKLDTKDFLVVPFGRLMRSAQLAIDLWTWDSLETQLPRTLSQSDRQVSIFEHRPKTWHEMVVYAWQLARDHKIMWDLSKEFTLSAAKLMNVEAQLKKEIDSFDSQRPELSTASSLPDAMDSEIFLWEISGSLSDESIDWETQDKMETTQIIRSFAIFRVLLAWFSNCVQHGDRKESIMVDLKPEESAVDGQSRYRLTIVNGIPASEEVKAPALFVAKRSSTLQVVRVALERLDGANVKAAPGEQSKYVFSCTFSWN